MDLEKYVDEYHNVSRKEAEKIRASTSSETSFVLRVRSLHEDREKEKSIGRSSLRPGPLIHVISVTLQPDTDRLKPQPQPTVIYGRIGVEFSDFRHGGIIGHDIYKRERAAAETLDDTLTLTLNGPPFSCLPSHAFMPMFRSRIQLELFDGDDNVFARGYFFLDDADHKGAYEQRKSMSMPCQQGSFTVHYVVIPFGLHCRINVMFYNNQLAEKRSSIDVNGKIVARYGNTYGNYSSQECVLFEKQDNVFETVKIDRVQMQLSRCWVTIPAYSSLIIGVDLSEFQSGRKIVTDTLELLPRQGLMTGDSFLLGDMRIEVTVAWFSVTPPGIQGECDIKSPANVMVSLSPTPQGCHNDMEIEEAKGSPGTQEMPTEETEEMDTDEEHESSSDDESSSLSIPWILRPHKNVPLPSAAIEIFSVLVGSVKLNAVWGSIEVLCGGRPICYVLKKDERDALMLSETVNSMSVLDGSREYEEFQSLSVNVDLKDINGSLAIKGYVDWAASTLDEPHHRNKLLCSFIHGFDGFVALHYSIFEEAVAANIKVFVKSTEGCSKIYGSVVCQFTLYDYSSQYNQDFFRNTLFERTHEETVQLNDDGTIPMSRSMVVVPFYSSLVINVDISDGVLGQKLLSCSPTIAIGDSLTTIKTIDCGLDIKIDWCEIK